MMTYIQSMRREMRDDSDERYASATLRSLVFAAGVTSKETKMTCKRLKGMSTIAFFLLAAASTSSADEQCSNATLKGLYGFSLRGQLIGIFDDAGNTHRFANEPVLIDAVSIQDFDGHGGFTRADFVQSGGEKRPGSTDPTTGFDTNESGMYTVYSDCTGIMHINKFPAPISSTTIDIRFVLTDGGRRMFGVVSRQVIGGQFRATDGTTCGPAQPCRMEAQESLIGEKFRTEGRDR